MESTQWHSCACFPIRLVAESFQCNPTMKLSNVNGMCVSSCRFATNSGPWVNVQSHQCGSLVVWMWCEALVTNLKSVRGGDGSFYGLWVLADGRRSSSCKRGTRLLTNLHRDLQQNHDTVDRVTGGRKLINFPRGMFNEVDLRFASSFYALCSRILIYQSCCILLTAVPCTDEM